MKMIKEIAWKEENGKRSNVQVHVTITNQNDDQKIIEKLKKEYNKRKNLELDFEKKSSFRFVDKKNKIFLSVEIEPVFFDKIIEVY